MRVQISKVAPRTWVNDKGKTMYTHKCFAKLDAEQEHPDTFSRTFPAQMQPGIYDLNILGWGLDRSGKLYPKTEFVAVAAAAKSVGNG